MDPVEGSRSVFLFFSFFFKSIFACIFTSNYLLGHFVTKTKWPLKCVYLRLEALVKRLLVHSVWPRA